jgi:hypothetical protein
MGAYAVWSHLGFYPVAGQDTYLLNRPYFPKITIRNEVTGSVAIIIASGLSDQNKYIQSATLNGQPYTKNWISHDLFLYGGTLTLVMGSNKNSTWGTGQEDLPMSLSTKGFGCDTCVSPTKLNGSSSSASSSSAPSSSPSIIPGGSSAVHEGAGGNSDKPSKAHNYFSYLIFLFLAD